MERPAGLPKPTDFAFVSEPIPAPGLDKVLIKKLYISLTPGLRVYTGAAKGLDGKYATKSDRAIRAWALGRVVSSQHSKFPVGSYVMDRPGNAGIQDYAVLPVSTPVPINPSVAPLPSYLGVLGTQGTTAHIGMFQIGAPKAGETVVVSAAAGVLDR